MVFKNNTKFCNLNCIVDTSLLTGYFGRIRESSWVENLEKCVGVA